MATQIPGETRPNRFDIATCGNCGRSWDDSISTQMTPVPSGRCPFEYYHDGEPIPADYPVKEVDNA